MYLFSFYSSDAVVLFLELSYIDDACEVLDLCKICGEKDEEIFFILELSYIDEDWILLDISINSGGKCLGGIFTGE